MKLVLFCMTLTTVTALFGDDSIEMIRKELETYKQRIHSLEKQQEQTLNPTEVATIRENWQRAIYGFEFHGYFRAGFGMNSNGDRMESFKAPNATTKYRLGNEADTFIEATFQQNFFSQELMNDDVDFFTRITFAYYTQLSGNHISETTTTPREVYAGARGVWRDQKEAMFWAGSRYYEHLNVHITDFFFRDLAGFGGGIEDVVIGDDSKLAIAWMGGTIDKLASGGPYTYNKNLIDLRLYEISTSIGRWALNADIAYFGGDNFTNAGQTKTNKVASSYGGALGAILTTDLSDNIVNQFSAQYGVGAAENFKTVMTAPQMLDDPFLIKPIETKDASRLRIIDDIVIKEGNPISLQAIAIYEHYNNGMGSSFDWISLGARPMYHFNKYFSLAFEGGVDYTNQNDGPEGVLGKFTIASQIQPGRGYYSRPSIRAFVTYAVWTGTDDFKRSVAPVSYENDSQGISFGVQMEVWW